MSQQHAACRRSGKGGLGLAGELRFLGDARQEALEAAGMLWRAAGVVALVVDAANQDRQLRRELRSLIDGEMVAQRVQEGAQDAVGVAAIAAVKLTGQLVQPDMRLLDGTINDVQVLFAHGLISRSTSTSKGVQALGHMQQCWANRGQHPSCETRTPGAAKY